MSGGAIDLFGEPVPANRGKRGRPVHCRTVENARKIQIAAALGHSEADCASMLGICLATLRKHYFFEVEGFARARLNLRMKAMAHLVDEVEKGNVAAIKELAKQIDRADAPGAAARDRGNAKPPKLGKKEQALDAARRVGEGEDSQWSFLNSRAAH